MTTSRHIRIIPIVDTPVGRHIVASHLILVRAAAIVSICLFGLSAVTALADTDRRIAIERRV